MTKDEIPIHELMTSPLETRETKGNVAIYVSVYIAKVSNNPGMTGKMPVGKGYFRNKPQCSTQQSVSWERHSSSP